MKKPSTVVFLMLLLIKPLWAQDEMFKSLFIYNFTKNIEWPGDYKTGNFIIIIVGNSPIEAELQKIAKLKKVSNQSIEIVKVNNASEIGHCHMVYITPAKSSQLAEVISKTGNNPVVVVGDKDGLASEGAGLNFIKVDGKQKFEINEKALKRNGLSVNSYLATLGITVE